MSKQVTERQLDQMRHALGLNYGKEMTRNNYYTDSDDLEWNDLVEKGYAVKRSGWDDESAYYHVTDEGKNIVLSEDGCI